MVTFSGIYGKMGGYYVEEQKEKYLKQYIEEYKKGLSAYAKVNIVEVCLLAFSN